MTTMLLSREVSRVRLVMFFYEGCFWETQYYFPFGGHNLTWFSLNPKTLNHAQPLSKPISKCFAWHLEARTSKRLKDAVPCASRAPPDAQRRGCVRCVFWDLSETLKGHESKRKLLGTAVCLFSFPFTNRVVLGTCF